MTKNVTYTSIVAILVCAKCIKSNVNIMQTRVAILVLLNTLLPNKYIKGTINIPKRGIGDKSIDALFDYARENNLSLYQAIDTYQGSGEKKMKAYKQLIDELTEQSNDKSLTDLFDMVFQQSGYREMLTNSKDPEDANRLENIKELMNDIEDFSKSKFTEDQLAFIESCIPEWDDNVVMHTVVEYPLQAK